MGRKLQQINNVSLSVANTWQINKNIITVNKNSLTDYLLRERRGLNSPPLQASTASKLPGETGLILMF